MSQRHATRAPRSAGFTILELLVVVAIIGLLAAIVVEAVQTFVPRFELRQASTLTQQLIAQARIEAIKRSVTTVVEADLDERTLTAFADVNGDPDNPSGPGGRYLVYDPDDTLPELRTDYLIGWVTLPGKSATGVQFGGPNAGIKGADSVSGFTPVPGATGLASSVLVFRATGAVEDPGAFRFVDAKAENFFETTVTAVTGKVEIRKYLRNADSPTGVPGFFAEANETFDDGSGTTSLGENIWVWY